MQTEIGVVWNRPGDRDWLIKLRKWVRAEGPTFNNGGARPRVITVTPLGEALSWRNQLPDDRLVVTVGFRREEIESSTRLLGCKGEPIILCEPDGANANGLATASFMDNPPIVPCKDIIPFVKKSLIRSALRRRIIAIRPPESDAEWHGYFSLRYKVWEECNYLRDENKRTKTKWEIDSKDRAAIPLCAITPEGKVVGCARVLTGQVEERYNSQIETLLKESGDETLRKLFSPPRCMKQPFDLLSEFPAFRAHFSGLIRERKKPAEISRVAVDPAYRRQSIAEALVDTAVAHAEARRLAPVLLACREKHALLYANSGFSPVEGLKSDKYLNIELPSIIMERQRGV
jgi:ribosomal protein S18 acetylase RimI-like enzyme